MAADIAITTKDISKTFRLPHEKTTSVKGAVVNFWRRDRTYERQKVLDNISFEVKKGEFFGIVGRNGSGKSTLLKLLAGIYAPSQGDIQINGKLTPFIELGVGFNPELTGRENVFLNGALLGFSRKQMQTMYKEIVEFAELERFMDQKLKNYSSGMQVRLAFSIAIRANTEVLILDEVLAVGDAAFQRKCYDYFLDLKKNKQTVVLVTHDMGAVRQYCDRAIMIEAGKIVSAGKPDEVAQAYQKLFNDEMNSEHEKMLARRGDPDKANRWGEGGLIADRPTVKVTNDTVTIKTTYRASAALPPPIYGFTIFGPKGDNMMEGNTLRKAFETEAVKPDDTVEITWELPNIFASGTYSMSVACCDQSTTRFYDWLNDATSFKVYKEGVTAGIADPPLKIGHYNVTRTKS
jgi:ABC-2 type transport system ATP-binding protein